MFQQNVSLILEILYLSSTKTFCLTTLGKNRIQIGPERVKINFMIYPFVDIIKDYKSIILL